MGWVLPSSLRQRALTASTPYGKVVFPVLAAVAELERSLITERIKAGLKKAAAQGHRPGPQIGAAGPSRSTLWCKGKTRAL